MKSKILLFVLLACVASARSSRPLVIAHRGASGYLPEHTLPAKALAHAMGADFLEQDVVLSKDGVALVLHDIEIDTVTDVAQRFPERKRPNGHYYAIDFTLAEIKQLRVTERFDPKTNRPVFKGRFPLWQSTFSVSTLEEELQFIQGLNRSTHKHVGIYTEIKAPRWHRQQGKDITAIVVKILARYGYRSKVDPFFVQCFEFEELKRLRTEMKFEGRLVQLVGRYGGGEMDAQGRDKVQDNTALLTREGLAQVAEIADGIGPSFSEIVRAGPDGRPQVTEVVNHAHALKLVVHPYTFRADALPKFVASPNQLLEILFDQAKIDGLFADQPDLVVAFLKHEQR